MSMGIANKTDLQIGGKEATMNVEVLIQLLLLVLRIVSAGQAD
jgi:hypothetical protein